MKKSNQKGFTHQVLLIGVAAVVIGAVAFGGYRVYKSNNIDAKAYSWSNLMTTPVTIKVCQTWVGGSNWRIRAQAVNFSNDRMNWRVIAQGTTVISQFVPAKSTSTVYNNTISRTGSWTLTGFIATAGSTGGAYGVPVSNSDIRNC